MCVREREGVLGINQVSVEKSKFLDFNGFITPRGGQVQVYKQCLLVSVSVYTGIRTRWSYRGTRAPRAGRQVKEAKYGHYNSSSVPSSHFFSRHRHLSYLYDL